MEGRNHSWHHLKEHSTPPPPELFEKLRQQLDPPADDARDKFRQLSDHSIPPPDKLRSGIMGSAATVQRRKISTMAYAAAAACILFLITGLVLYFRSPDQNSRIAVKRSHQTQPALPIAMRPGDSAKMASTPQAARDSTDNPGIQLSHPALVLDGEQFAFTDNSPLMTFVSYRYNALGSHIHNRKNQSALRIGLDQYTNITLSPAMSATLRDLYDTRPDGSTSKKARKTRERLEKWNIEDKKEFDTHNASSPLDPVDLGEFLFPPLFPFGRHSGNAALPAATAAASPSHAESDSAMHTGTPLTVSYTLTLITRRTNTGIAETYNGGIQTLFTQGGYSRLRLASLMRIQSILTSPANPAVTILTESEKPMQQVSLTSRQWSALNAKFTGITRELINDSLVILGYPCKKALLTLRDGRHIAAWYTPDIQQTAQARIEPMFATIPGLVLQYEYTCRRKTLRYTATSLSRQPIAPTVFTIH